MTTHLFISLFAVVSVVALIPVSMLLNALRRQHPAPTQLAWAPLVPIRHANVGGNRLRYIKTGNGPTLVLLHTLRTHLDLFQKIIPELAKDFTVYALDYPGHGWSDIPRAEYTPAFLANAVRDFLAETQIENAVVVGESIGGTIPLLLAVEDDSRIRAVIAVNPYDYKRRFTMRAAFLTRLTFWIGAIPMDQPEALTRHIRSFSKAIDLAPESRAAGS